MPRVPARQIFRVGVTGSRKWTDRVAVESALSNVLVDEGEFILVQGDNPRGADRMAKLWAIKFDIPHEDVPADWDRECDDQCFHRERWRDGRNYCPVAGNLRNQVMVDRGMDLLLAFPLPDSTGTIDCMKRAAAADILTLVIPEGYVGRGVQPRGPAIRSNPYDQSGKIRS